MPKMTKIVENPADLLLLSIEIVQNPGIELELEVSTNWVIDWNADQSVPSAFLKTLRNIEKSGGRITSLKAPHLWDLDPAKWIDVDLPTLEVLNWNDHYPFSVMVAIGEDKFKNLRFLSLGEDACPFQIYPPSQFFKILEGAPNLEEIKLRARHSSENAQMQAQLFRSPEEFLDFLQQLEIYISSNFSIRRFDIESEQFDLMLGENPEAKDLWTKIQRLISKRQKNISFALLKETISEYQIAVEKYEEYKAHYTADPKAKHIKGKYEKYRKILEEKEIDLAILKGALLKFGYETLSFREILEVATLFLRNGDRLFDLGCAFQLLDKIPPTATDEYPIARCIIGHDVLNHKDFTLAKFKALCPEWAATYDLNSEEGRAMLSLAKTQFMICCLSEAYDPEIDVRELLDKLLYGYVVGGMRDPRDDRSQLDFWNIPRDRIGPFSFFVLDLLKKELKNSKAKDTRFHQLTGELQNAKFVMSKSAQELEETRSELERVKEELVLLKSGQKSGKMEEDLPQAQSGKPILVSFEGTKAEREENHPAMTSSPEANVSASRANAELYFAL